MRVTLVSPFDPRPPEAAHGRAHVGGVERVFDELSKGLAARGHDLTLVCSTDGRPTQTQDGGIRIVRVRRATTLMRAPVANLAKHVPRDTDIVHVAATYPFTTPAVLERAHHLGIPSVLDFHFEPAPGSFLGKAAAAVYRRIGPRAYPLADAVIVRSFSYGRTAKSLARVSEVRWRVVPNGVDTQRFHPDGPAAGGRYILFVGRLVPYKGLGVLLEAMSRLRPPIPLVIAGDGPLRDQLKKKAVELGVEARFLGYIPDEGLPQLYRGARLTVLPSVTQQEAFGMTLLESMACGTPVVASDLPGMADVARIGGLLAKRGDAESLATKIEQALVPGALPRAAFLARKVQDTYSWPSVTDRLIEVYSDVLERRGRRSQGSTAPEVTKAAHPGGHPVL